MTDEEFVRNVRLWSLWFEPEWPEFDVDAGLDDLFARIECSSIAFDNRGTDIDNGRAESEHHVARRLIGSSLPADSSPSEARRFRELIGAGAGLVNGGFGDGFRIETLVSSRVYEPGGPDAEITDHRSIIDLCRETRSVGEIAAYLKQPVTIIQDLVDDLKVKGMVTVHPPPRLVDGQPSLQFIEDIISGLRGLNSCSQSERKEVTSAKIIVTGGTSSLRSAFIDAVSEVPPVVAHATSATEDESPMLIKMARISLAEDLILYLLDAPSPKKESVALYQLMDRAIGAVVLVDSCKPLDSIDSINRFELMHVPYVAVVQQASGNAGMSVGEIRKTLAISKTVPMIEYANTSPLSVKGAMISLVDHAMRIRTGTRRWE